jgi:hypothetical protein
MKVWKISKIFSSPPTPISVFMQDGRATTNDRKLQFVTPNVLSGMNKALYSATVVQT